MNYTLITPSGKVYTFYLKGLAESYQQAYGGVVLSSQTLMPEEKEVAVENNA